jgi:sugar lactone lactonase YvrE
MPQRRRHALGSSVSPSAARTARPALAILLLVVAAFAVAGAAAQPAAAAVVPADTYLFYNDIGGPGTAQGTFGFGVNPAPYGVAVDAQGNVYATDGNHSPMIQKFGRDGTWITEFGTFGTGAGNLTNPYAVAVGTDGTVYVLDTWRTANDYRIQKFYSADGGLTYASAGQVSTPEIASGKGFYLAVDADGAMYVSDAATGSGHVYKYGATGTLLTTIGTYGSGTSQLQSPRGLAVTADGATLYVCDIGVGELKVFSRDVGGSYSETDSWLGSDVMTGLRPYNVALTPDGDFFVLDSNLTKVFKLGPDFKNLTGWRSVGSGDYSFRFPWGIAVDADGDVYISDPGSNGGMPAQPFPGNHRVVRYTRDLTPPVSSVVVAPKANAAGWTKAASATLTFSANDPVVPDQAQTGWMPIMYRLNGGIWKSSDISIPPDGMPDPVTLARQGVTKVEYYTEDGVGNVEATQSVTVRLDNVRPATKALHDATARRYRTVTVRFRVNDVSGAKAKVTLKFRKVGTTRTKSIAVGQRSAGRDLSYSFRCALAKGTWVWKVYATDLAGNTQATMTSKKLFVK